MQSSGNNLAQRLGDEVRAAASLLDILKQEQSCLIAANVDALSPLTEEKTKVIVRMNEMAQTRHRALADAGFSANEEGMEQWAKHAAPETSKAWSTLLDLARQAKELNRVNGMLIGQHLARNQATLNVLRGTPQGGAMYGPNGQSSLQNTSRKLVVG